MKLQPVLACPNTPPCPHWLHDINDYDDPIPTCVEDDCSCGKTPADAAARAAAADDERGA